MDKLTKSERTNLHAVAKSVGVGKFCAEIGVSPKQLGFWIDGCAVPTPDNLRKVRRRLSKNGKAVRNG